MYELFFSESELVFPVIQIPSFDYIKRTYEVYINNVLDYYHNSVFSINYNHLLSRLLTNLGGSHSVDAERFAITVETRAPYLAKSFNLTSGITYGEIFNGTFYGPGNNEILISNETYFNPYDIKSTWKQLSPINILTHPISNMSLLLPTGKNKTIEQGLVCIEIDLPLLAMQFRAFMLNQVSINSERTDMLDVTHFLMKYPIPNVIKKQTDLAILNRLMNIYYGKPMPKALYRHPFPIIDYTDKLDYVLGEVLERIENRTMKYEGYLRNIPAINHLNMQKVLRLPYVPLTRQISWAIMMSRLNVVKFLIDVGGKKGIQANMTEINILKRYLKRTLNENILVSRLPEELAYEAGLTIEKILSI